MNGDCVSAGPVAISVLRDQSNNYVGEDFEGLAITKFDGTTITVLGSLPAHERASSESF